MSIRTDRKPKSELRHWSTYASVGEWYDDYHGYVPSMMAVGLSQLMRKQPELTFPQAYASLLGAGRIIELHGAISLSARSVASPSGPSLNLERPPRWSSPMNEKPRFHRGINVRRLLEMGLVASRHRPAPMVQNEVWVCRVCGHGVNEATRADRSFWRHNPKTFSRKEAPNFPYR
jgi:hypothetical protein